MSDTKQVETVDNGLLVRAPAKINLSLLITGKRPDGFHGIETIMAKLAWYDELLIEPGEKPGIEVISRGKYWAPQGKENLIYKACKSLLGFCGVDKDLKVTLTKNIPAGSGLGSASSDAASTLIGVNKFLNLGLGNDELKKLAADLGADVAFFLDGALAFCTGKGEKVKKIEKIFDFLAILMLPNVSVSTKKVYEHYTHNNSKYKELNSKINSLLEKNEIALIPELCANMLQTSCFELHRELAELKKEAQSLGCGQLCLSGSGCAMYKIVDFDNLEETEKFQHELKEKLGCESVLVRSNRW